MLRRAFAIVFRPAAAWQALADADPDWRTTVGRHVLPLALLPAIAWPLGQGGGIAAAAYAFGATWILTVATVLLFALGIYALSPFFGRPRDWNRSVSVAGYASTPVLLSGALLIVPILVLASVAAFIHLFVLAHAGLIRVVGCAEADATAFVAASCMFTGVTSMLLGFLCSAAGVI